MTTHDSSKPSPNDADAAKTALRTGIKQALDAMNDEERHAASVAASGRFTSLEVFRHATVIMLYMPLAKELDLTPIAVRCFQTGKTVCVPKVDWDRKSMTAVEATSFDDNVMAIDEHGLRTPRQGAAVPNAQIDVIVVPGLAFDAQGNRLGRGSGFYDRFLSRLRSSTCAVALGFDKQVVDAVPHADHDSRVDMIVTDRRVIHANPALHRRH